MQKLLILLLLSVFLASCKQTPEQEPADLKGRVVLKMDNRAGIRELVLGRNPYVNAAGDTFTVSTFNYFISNIRLRNAKGEWLTIPRDSSYFLVKEEDPASQRLLLQNIPFGRYDAVEWMIGVDSAKSTQPLGARSGALDPGGVAEGMYWTWNSGYIFLKLEGESPAVAVDKQFGRAFWFHIGGFGGYNQQTINNLRTVRLEFPEGEFLSVREGQSRPSSAHLLVDVLKIMDGPTRISLAEHRGVMFVPFAKNVADNYIQMFAFSHVENY
jgi:hypothetical protein